MFLHLKIPLNFLLLMSVFLNTRTHTHSTSPFDISHVDGGERYGIGKRVNNVAIELYGEHSKTCRAVGSVYCKPEANTVCQLY